MMWKHQDSLRPADHASVADPMDAEAAIEEHLAPALKPHDGRVASIEFGSPLPSGHGTLHIIVEAKDVSKVRRRALEAVLDEFAQEWAGEVVVKSTVRKARAPHPAPSWMQKAHRVFRLLSTAGTSRVVGPWRHR